MIPIISAVKVKIISILEVLKEVIKSTAIKIK